MLVNFSNDLVNLANKPNGFFFCKAVDIDTPVDLEIRNLIHTPLVTQQ